MTPELHWSDDADGARSLFAGNLPHAIGRGEKSQVGMWRYRLELPGSQHMSIATPALRDLAEGAMERWAAAWFQAVTA